MDPVKLWIIQPTMLVYQSVFFLPSPQTLLPATKKPPSPAGHLRHGGLRDAGGHRVSIGTSRWWRLCWADRAVVGIHDAWWKVSGRLGVFGAQKINPHEWTTRVLFPIFFFKWCLLTGVCFFYLGGGSSGPFFSPKGMFFVKWKDTGRCRCKGTYINLPSWPAVLFLPPHWACRKKIKKLFGDLLVVQFWVRPPSSSFHPEKFEATKCALLVPGHCWRCWYSVHKKFRSNFWGVLVVFWMKRTFSQWPKIPIIYC